MYGHGAHNAGAQAMNRFGRIICLFAWAAVIAAWAIPPKPAPAVMPNLNAKPPATEDSADKSSSSKLYAAGALPFAMEPADLWAIANLKFKELPPVEYDHAATDAVEIVDMSTEKELREVCHLTEAYRGGECSRVRGTKGPISAR
jgi:hypothetical protein